MEEESSVFYNYFFDPDEINIKVKKGLRYDFTLWTMRSEVYRLKYLLSSINYDNYFQLFLYGDIQKNTFRASVTYTGGIVGLNFYHFSKEQIQALWALRITLRLTNPGKPKIDKLLDVIHI